jgi:hypothetical protein
VDNTLAASGWRARCRRLTRCRSSATAWCCTSPTRCWASPKAARRATCSFPPC